MTSDERHWYTARTLFETIIGGEHLGRFEERFFLVSGYTEDSALVMAKDISAQKETIYRNVYGQEVYEMFLRVLDIVEVMEPQLVEGVEVYYHLLNASEVEEVEKSLAPDHLGIE